MLCGALHLTFPSVYILATMLDIPLPLQVSSLPALLCIPNLFALSLSEALAEEERRERRGIYSRCFSSSCVPPNTTLLLDVYTLSRS